MHAWRGIVARLQEGCLQQQLKYRILLQPNDSFLQGLLLSNNSEKMNSMNLLLHMAPLAAVLLVPMTIVAEPGVLQIVRQKAAQDKS